MLKSFINEHTAEYVLVPKFAEILKEAYPVVIPIFFWSTREGGVTARNSLKDFQFQIVAMYARRPKILHIKQDHVDVKFNETLFLRSNHLQKSGIPVFAGVPIVSTLREFQLDLPCAWFRINPSGYECAAQISSQNKLLTNGDSAQKVSKEDILHRVTREAKHMSWDHALESLKLKKHSFDEEWNPYGMWGQIYKPVFFVLPNC